MTNPASSAASSRSRTIAAELAVGHGAGALGPIIFAVIALASWALRPSARRDLAPGPSSWILARPVASR
jgi:hypothetical protein